MALAANYGALCCGLFGFCCVRDARKWVTVSIDCTERGGFIPRPKIMGGRHLKRPIHRCNKTKVYQRISIITRIARCGRQRRLHRPFCGTSCRQCAEAIGCSGGSRFCIRYATDGRAACRNHLTTDLYTVTLTILDGKSNALARGRARIGRWAKVALARCRRKGDRRVCTLPHKTKVYRRIIGTRIARCGRHRRLYRACCGTRCRQGAKTIGCGGSIGLCVGYAASTAACRNLLQLTCNIDFYPVTLTVFDGKGNALTNKRF